MPPSVSVVTDSTAYLPAELVAQHRLTVVPLHVTLGPRSAAEGVEVSPADVAAALQRHLPVSTSRPAPAELAAAYRSCPTREVVSIHLSGGLSGTVESARQAAAEVAADGISVQVVDSRAVAMGLGFAVLAATQVAEAGAAAAEVVAAAERVAAGVRTTFYVDTLEYLRRGGRIGAASALVGAALAIKPLLEMADGVIRPLEKVRTASRALARLADLAVAAGGAAAVDVAVHHLGAPERANTLAGALRGRLTVRELVVTEVGAVVGAHAGPGLVATVVSPGGGLTGGLRRSSW